MGYFYLPITIMTIVTFITGLGLYLSAYDPKLDKLCLNYNIKTLTIASYTYDTIIYKKCLNKKTPLRICKEYETNYTTCYNIYANIKPKLKAKTRGKKLSKNEIKKY